MTARSRKFGPRLTISLTPQDYDQLAHLASNQDASVSWVVRRAIEEYLAHGGDLRSISAAARKKKA